MNYVAAASYLKELKPDYANGESAEPHLTASMDLGGVETANQTRRDTLDDPHGDQAGIAGPIDPIYESIEPAKNGMLITRGPPVPNPVYGPTATPISTSSLPLPYKAAPNPLYAETAGAQIHDVSALHPASVPVGELGDLESPICDKTIPCHTDTQSKVETGASESYNRVPNLRPADPLTAPVYEEIQTTGHHDAVSGVANQVGDTMTRNMSYGSNTMTMTRNMSYGSNTMTRKVVSYERNRNVSCKFVGMNNVPSQPSTLYYDYEN